jgi:hypothetical protein
MDIRNDDGKMLKAKIRRGCTFRIWPPRSIKLQKFDCFVAKAEPDRGSPSLHAH